MKQISNKGNIIMPCVANIQAQIVDMTPEQLAAFAVSAGAIVCAMTAKFGVGSLSDEQRRFVADHERIDLSAG